MYTFRPSKVDCVHYGTPCIMTLCIKFPNYVYYVEVNTNFPAITHNLFKHGHEINPYVDGCHMLHIAEDHIDRL